MNMEKNLSAGKGIRREWTKGMMILFAVAFGIGCSILIMSLFGKQLRILFPNYFALEFVSQLISVLIGFLMIFLLRKQRVFSVTANGMKEGLACGAPLVVAPILAIANLAIDLRDVPDLQLIRGFEIALLLFQCLLIGLFEEMIFRGIALELSFEIFGTQTKKQAKLAIAFVSFLFGAMHMINAIHPALSVKAAAFQAFSAFGLGLVFGAIYYRSGRSILPCVILHAVQDASAFVASGTLYGVTQEEAIGNTGIGQAVFSILFIAWFFYLMREREE